MTFLSLLVAAFGSVAVGGVAGCGEEEPRPLVEDPLAPWPQRFADVGLHPQPGDRDVAISRAVGYAPGWPLWSSGSAKHRHLVIPEGAVIETDGDVWRFPSGTLLFKTFTYDDALLGERPVETRVLRQSAPASAEERWEYAVYRWNDNGDDAELLSLDVSESVSLPDGSTHTIPARLECRMCHETAPHPVLGFEPLQLTDGPGTAGSAWSDVVAAGVFSRDPGVAPGIEHSEPAVRQILGMFYGNCVHCHHGGEGDNASFDLRPGVALANTIDQPTASSASADGVRIVPGAPEQSVLFLAVSGEHDDPDLEDMPPVGIDRRDLESIERLRAFIEGL